MKRPRPARRPPPRLIAHRQHDGTMRVRYGAFEISKRGAERYDWRDPYYIALALRWRWFVLALLVLNVVLNAFFASLYVIRPGAIANARPGCFTDAFFFSIETFATVGYGSMSPATLYGHAIASIEVMCGMAFTAIATGLTFVRFSRPRAKILYADMAVVGTHRGRRTLMVRIGNGRLTPLTGASARLTALIGEETDEGQYFRIIHELPLLQPTLPVFALTWTIMHDLEGDSPLGAFGPAELAAADVQLFLSLRARDPLLAVDIDETHRYAAADIQFGMRYADAVSLDADGHLSVDLTRISLTEPDAGLSHRTHADNHT